MADPRRHDRALVLDQTGLISVINLEDGALTTFLDLRDRVVPLMPDYDERGLLGLAFHPDFAENGRLFVYYGAPVRNAAPAAQDHTNTLSEFRADPADPRRADPASERTILRSSSRSSTTAAARSGSGRTGCSTSAPGTAAARATRARAIPPRATPRT